MRPSWATTNSVTTRSRRAFRVSSSSRRSASRCSASCTIWPACQLLLLVTGPLGGGKTLLRQALVASTNKDAVLSVVISARTAADETSLLRQVAQGLSINQASLEAILTRWRSWRSPGRTST